MELVQAFILGIVEGITEFLPISSTGHLIIAGRLLGFEGEKANTFEIFIQLGAILAVVFLYWQRFMGLLDFKAKSGFRGLNGITLLIITSIPALFLGFIGRDFIKTNLFNPTTVAIGLGVGGVALILVELLLPKSKVDKIDSLDKLTWREALVIGLFQCLALWPGASRSASTIVGGMIMKLERKTAAEYSFFAAVPALFAATAYELLKSLKILNASDIPTFAIGFVVSFITAWLAVKSFIALLSRFTLIPFGWYRIIVAIVVLLFIR